MCPFEGVGLSVMAENGPLDRVAELAAIALGKRLDLQPLDGLFRKVHIGPYFRGVTTVVAAGQRSFKELARNALDEPIYASPALTRSAILVRTPEHLYCIESSVQDAKP